MNTVVIQDTAIVVNIGTTGPKGLDGSGGGSSSFEFQQRTPSDIWIINHGLGFRPSVELFTDGGQEFIGEVIHTSLNQTQVLLVTASTGSARLN